jgi:hypothetical protein
MSDKQCLVILDAELQPLGEVWFNEDVFSHVLLGDDGEQELGPWIEEWQTQGLDRVADDEDDGLTASRVNLRADDFSDALDDWLQTRGYVSLSLPEQAVPSWHLMQSAYEDPRQRFEQAVRLRDLNDKEDVDWDKQYQILALQLSSVENEETVKKNKSKPTAKSVKSIKSKTVSKAKTKTNVEKSIKSVKSVKSIKLNKSLKSVRSNKSKSKAMNRKPKK